jgi:two-component system KDP operon response regulator KdpE
MMSIADNRNLTIIPGIDLDLAQESHKRLTALIVDDEPETIRMLKYVLMEAGMDVVGASSGLDAIEKCPHAQPDIILLDLMMPEMDGYETFRFLRNITNAPILVVSAKSQKEDIVEGLKFGADDYLTKPFYPAELVARINTVVKRSRYVEPIAIYSFPNLQLSIDIESREVKLRGESFLLPRVEFEVLYVLAKFAPKLVTKEVIAHEVWGEDSDKIQKRIKYFVHILRRKLEADPHSPRMIISREGLGYRLATDETLPVNTRRFNIRKIGARSKESGN